MSTEESTETLKKAQIAKKKKALKKRKQQAKKTAAATVVTETRQVDDKFVFHPPAPTGKTEVKEKPSKQALLQLLEARKLMARNARAGTKPEQTQAEQYKRIQAFIAQASSDDEVRSMIDNMTREHGTECGHLFRKAYREHHKKELL